jgi:hypothetical protein
MSGERLNHTEVGRFKKFVYRRFLFAAAFVMLSAGLICFDFGGLFYSVSAGAENVFEDADELTRGHVRLLTEKIYFLENTELEFETYGDEKVDTVIYTYKGNGGLSVPDSEGKVFIRIYWTDGFLGGTDYVELVVQTDYDPTDDDKGVIESRISLKLIFYDAVFRYADGETYYANDAPADLYPELKTETPEFDRERFNATVKENIYGIEISALSVVKPSAAKDGTTVYESSDRNISLTSAVFPQGINEPPKSFFDALTEVFGEEFSEIYEIKLKIEYFSRAEYQGYPKNETFSVKTIGFTLRRLEKTDETTKPMTDALENFVADAGKGGAIDAQGLKNALNLDEMILNSFDKAVLVCEVLKRETFAAKFTVDLKGENGDSPYMLDTGEYKFVFSLYLDEKLFFSSESKKNIKTTFLESLDIDGSPEGGVKIFTIVMGAAVLAFVALAAATVVYRKKSEAKAGQGRLSGRTVLSDYSYENGLDKGNFGGNEDGRMVLSDGERRDKGNFEEYKEAGLDDYSYDYLYEDEPTGVYYAEEAKDEVRENYNDENTEKNKNTINIKENDSGQRGFSYEKLTNGKKKFSLGEKIAGFDADLSEMYASSGNGNILKEKLEKNSNKNPEKKDEER